MKLDVYQTDAEAFEAAAARVAAMLGGATADARRAVALPGGRTGRGALVALAARGDLPWGCVDWFWGDERCGGVDDAESNVRLARESLFIPRGVPVGAVHVPPLDLGDARRIAEAYAGTLRERLGGDGGVPVFDLVLLTVGRDGHVAALMPGSAALEAAEAVVAVTAREVTVPPRRDRITVTPPVLRAARSVLVVATGDECAAAVARVLRDPLDVARVPAQLVRPGPTVEWIVDRAAAAELLRTARVAPDQ
jgi:6-phosphogluconolactonase